MTNLDENSVQYLARHLCQNNVVLFLGAGFSVDATNAIGDHLPTSRSLAEQLWDYLEYSGPYDGTAVGLMYEAALTHTRGQTALHIFLRDRLTATSFPDWYRQVTPWFWYRIYSANVDNLVELIYDQHRDGPTLEPIIAPCEYQDPDSFLRRMQFIKLHGSTTDLSKGLTFSQREYGRRAAEQDVWYDHFVRDFSTRPTIFIGTELDEPLFWQYVAVRQRRVSPNERRPKSFLVCPSISPAKRDALRQFNVLPIETTAEQFLTQLVHSIQPAPSREEVILNVDPSLQELFAPLPTPAASTLSHAEEFFSVFSPVLLRQPSGNTRSHFLLGSPPTWEDMHRHFDADREINHVISDLVKQQLGKNPTRTPVVVLTGPAGSGKTTIAKRLSLWSAGEGFPAYFAEGDQRPMHDAVLPYLRQKNTKTLLVFDEATADLRLITELAAKCDELDQKPVIFLTARANELAARRHLLQGIENLIERRVPDLSDRDIAAIIETLAKEQLLGELRHLTYDEQVNVFQTKARKQILVAMREATKGYGFDEIIEQEFSGIKSDEARLVYLIAAIPSMQDATIKRGQIIAAMDGPPLFTSNLIDEDLEGILVASGRSLGALQIRHPIIAQHIVENVAPRADLADAYVRFLEVLAHDLPPRQGRQRSKIFRIYRDSINHTRLHSLFVKQPELCRSIYEAIKGHFEEDGHYWLQYGSYELEFGDLDFAENFLLQAEGLMPHHPWVGTWMGYLLLRKAVEANTLMAANELYERGRERLQRQILSVGATDPYPYHVLGSQGLAFINKWVPAVERPTRLQELREEVLRGHRRHSLSNRLRRLAEDIKRAELSGVTVDAPRAGSNLSSST